MPEPLTSLERQIYHYLLDYLTEHTYQPSVREIGHRFRIKSTKTVSELLESIARKGYVERDPSRSRGVRLIGYAGTQRTMPVPFYTRVAAEEPALRPDHHAGFITMDRRFVPNEQVFYVKIAGDNLTERGILDGDYVMIDPSPRVNDGDATSYPGGDAQVRIMAHRDGLVTLLPVATDASPVTDTAALLGRICGVFRPLSEEGRGQDSVDRKQSAGSRKQ